MNMITIQNFNDYEDAISLVSNSDLCSEFIDLNNMLESDCTNGYCVEIIIEFYDIVIAEMNARFIAMVSAESEEE